MLSDSGGSSARLIQVDLCMKPLDQAKYVFYILSLPKLQITLELTFSFPAPNISSAFCNIEIANVPLATRTRPKVSLFFCWSIFPPFINVLKGFFK